ncbi:MAG: hypothetical protein WC295_03615 [Methanoregula sp.]
MNPDPGSFQPPARRLFTPHIPEPSPPTPVVAVIMASDPLATAHTGTIIHDPEIDGFSATLRCRNPNGGIYSVNFARDRLEHLVLPGRHPGRHGHSPRVR